MQGGVVKQVPAVPSMIVVTVLAFTFLACAECNGGVETAQAKSGRSAAPVTSAGRESRKAHRAVARTETRVRSFIIRKSSSHIKITTKQKPKHDIGMSRHACRRNMNDRSLKSRSAMLGVASFYSEDKETASGDRFDKHALTAAHRTLPFGTHLRVTNVRNGRSVTVRVNDRGPFMRGRIIDVTAAAAEALGMIEAGTTNVTLDIVRSGMPRRSSQVVRRTSHPELQKGLRGANVTPLINQNMTAVAARSAHSSDRRWPSRNTGQLRNASGVAADGLSGRIER
jgi:peptidoglycan lytic transglycosylase